MGCDQSKPAPNPNVVEIPSRGGCSNQPGACDGCDRMKFDADGAADPRLLQFISQEQYTGGLRKCNEYFGSGVGRCCLTWKFLVGGGGGLYVEGLC